MKILIAADMEGITGVVHWDHVNTQHAEYPRFRRLMTADVNAAIRGAVEGGAEEVVVADGHAYGRNILIEELDPRARLNSGTPSPLQMVSGVDEGVDGVFYVGYHARVGTPNAILEHTWSSAKVAGLWLEEVPTGEIRLNALVCGHFGVPVAMISGDRAACAEARAQIGEVEQAVVKVARGRQAAECLPPDISQAAIQAAAARATGRLRLGQAPQPLALPGPIRLRVEFHNSEMADGAAILPGARRGEGRQVEYTGQDMLEIYRAFRSLVGLG